MHHARQPGFINTSVRSCVTPCCTSGYRSSEVSLQSHPLPFTWWIITFWCQAIHVKHEPRLSSEMMRVHWSLVINDGWEWVSGALQFQQNGLFGTEKKTWREKSGLILQAKCVISGAARHGDQECIYNRDPNGKASFHVMWESKIENELEANKLIWGDCF